MRFALAIAGLLTAVAGAAEAADPKPQDAVQQYVAVSPVAIPIIVNGKIVNYVFVNVRVDLTARADSTKLREREPYFRDALVRAAHRTPFTDPNDYTRIDEAKLKAALLRDAAAIAGPNAIRGVTITSQAPKSMRVSVR
jgi:flagellar basal body-associated protein FliL